MCYPIPEYFQPRPEGKDEAVKDKPEPTKNAESGWSLVVGTI